MNGGELRAVLRTLALSLALGIAAWAFGEDPQELLEATRVLYRGDPGGAAAQAESYLRVHPQATPALILLARAHIAQGKYPLAFAELRKALQRDPKNLDTLYYLGRLCGILSLGEYQQLYRWAPDSARVHQLLAESYLAQEDKAKAEEEFQAVLRADPQSVEALDALGDLKRSQFQFEQAIEFYSRAHAVNPRDYDSAYGLGASYLYRHEPERAVEEFRKALQIDPKSAAARLALGDALLRAGQAAKAVIELESALTIEPRMQQAYTLLARAYQRLGKAREAAEALRKSDELNRQEQEARQGLIMREMPPDLPRPPGDDQEQPAAPKP